MLPTMKRQPSLKQVTGIGMIVAYGAVAGAAMGALCGTMTFPNIFTLMIGTYFGATAGTVLSLPHLAGNRRYSLRGINLWFLFVVVVGLTVSRTKNIGLHAFITIPAAVLLSFVVPPWGRMLTAEKAMDFRGLLLAPCLCVVAAVLLLCAGTERLPHDAGSLARLMESGSGETRRDAARKLVKYGDPKPFLEAMQNQDPDVRADAAHFVGFGDFPAEAVHAIQEALVTCCNDRDYYVKMWAAYSLGNLGDEKCVPVLQELIRTQDDSIQKKADDAIVKINNRHRK